MGKTNHLSESPSRHNIPSMDKAVQVPRRFFDGLAHLIVAV